MNAARMPTLSCRELSNIIFVPITCVHVFLSDVGVMKNGRVAPM